MIEKVTIEETHRTTLKGLTPTTIPTPLCPLE